MRALTQLQLELLLELIDTDRTWRTRAHALNLQFILPLTERGVTLGSVSGHQYRSAKGLEAAGIADIVEIDGTMKIYLGKFYPYNEV